MEGIIFFIIIIVVLNLLGRIMGAGKQRQVPSRHRGQMPGETRVEKPAEEMTYYRSSRSFDRDFGFDDKSWKEDEDEPDEVSAENLPEKPVRRKKIKATGGSGSREKTKPGTNGSSVNLRSIFGNKNSLVSAFIFHELLEPPRALKKKRSKSRQI